MLTEDRTKTDVKEQIETGKPTASPPALVSRLGLIREIIKDWHRGKLSGNSAMIIVSSIVSPIEPSEADKEAP